MKKNRPAVKLSMLIHQEIHLKPFSDAFSNIHLRWVFDIHKLSEKR